MSIEDWLDVACITPLWRCPGSSLACSTTDHQALPHSQSSPLCHQLTIAGAFPARSTSASATALATTQPRVVMRRKPLTPPQGHFPPASCGQGVPFGAVRSSAELPQNLKQLPSQDSLISTGAPQTGCLR